MNQIIYLFGHQQLPAISLHLILPLHYHNHGTCTRPFHHNHSYTSKMTLSQRFLTVSWLLMSAAMADVVLDKKTMKLALTSAELSALAYEINPPIDGYDMLKSFNDGTFFGSVPLLLDFWFDGLLWGL